MRVQIEQIICENESLLVKFSSDFGSAIAFWYGEKPTIKVNYQVEVDINQELEWGKEVLIDETSNDTICLKKDNTLISGSIESIDEDGYTILRLGENIIPFVAVGKAFVIGTHVILSVKSIVFSPVDY